ncbi:MAG: CbiX/SirB N-terminal domain-containing protein, partial [Chloroflexota bacterium]
MIPLLTNSKQKALVLIGHGSRDTSAISEYYQFSKALSQHLDIPVQACFLEFADPPIIEGLRLAIEAGAKHIVALPLFLGAGGHQKNDVPTTINWTR